MFLVRPARLEDVEGIVGLVRDLALYEKALEEVEVTPESLRAALFGEKPGVFAHVVQHEGDDGQVLAGFALWFLNFSTWLGRHGIYLEDFYVRPEFRGRGYGKALMQALARICKDRGYGRFEWSVLDWNEPSIAMYKKLGARPMAEWTVFRVTGHALDELAA